VAGDDESLQTQALQSHTATSLARLQAQRARAALPPATWAAARQTLDRLAAQAIASPDAPAILPTQAPPWNPELEQALAAEQAARSSGSSVRSQLREALALWRLRQAQLGTLERIAQAQDELVADSQRRYNGMLQSTWELLASVREQLAAQEAVQATRHALWLAHLQVLHLLAGGDHITDIDAHLLDPACRGWTDGIGAAGFHRADTKQRRLQVAALHLNDGDRDSGQRSAADDQIAETTEQCARQRQQ